MPQRKNTNTLPQEFSSTPPSVAIPWRSWKAWSSLLLGVALVGLGIGLMVEAGWGVSPLDAFFSGVSNQSDFSMGIVLAVFSVAMVLVAWLFGVKPGNRNPRLCPWHWAFCRYCSYRIL